jgi:hypothetical protein
VEEEEGEEGVEGEGEAGVQDQQEVEPRQWQA